MQFEKMIERFDRLEKILNDRLPDKKADKKPNEPIIDKYLSMLVIKLKMPSKMNFTSNKQIFKAIGSHLGAQSPAGVSKILIRHGFKPARVTDFGVRQRGFYLKLVSPLPTVEEIRNISE